MAQLLIWFILLFYVPTLFFRFFASRRVDLSRRKIPNQIEDFFAAALPSVLFNVVAWLLLNTLTLWKLAETTAVVPLLLTNEGSSYMQRNMFMIGAYTLSVFAVAAVSGWIYGWVELETTLLGVDVAGSLSGELWRIARKYHALWAIFFDRERVLMFPWLVHPTYVFVRTTDRLYHGVVEDYDRNSEGEINGIILDQVKRLDAREKALEQGTNFITPLQGTLWIRWSTITDINVADIGAPTTLDRISQEFEVNRQQRAKARRSIWRFFRR